ncbi:MAG: hypothetical protein KC931_26405, partial [Candidatus Omnitrophica bacterium]|nr:hypothetical protein [Candidatus Omnitrophota bacterium]
FNSVLCGNGDKEIYLSSGGGEVKVSYSNIQGGWPGEGNIDADPLFMDSENGDFRLQENSPCIDSASTMGPMTDIDGNERPVDITGVGRDGTGDEFDMGPFERLASGNPTFTPTFTPTSTNTPTVTPTPTNTPTPKVLYVSKDASPGGDGLSWENAFQEIDTAVDEAVNGDSIYVKQGHYDERIRFSKALTLLGGFKGDEEEGEIEGRDPKSCGIRSPDAGVASLVVDRQDDNRFWIDGFTLFGTDDGTDSNAAAFINRHASGMFSNVIFTEGYNKTSGGGLETLLAKLVIRDSTFTNNRAAWGGGGMYFNSSEVDLHDCLIVDNTAAYISPSKGDSETKGNEIPYWGGGILGEDSIIRATDCVIERNDALSA